MLLGRRHPGRALRNAEEAVAAWIDAALDAGETIPSPSAVDAICGIPEYEGWLLAVVEVDPALLDDTIERVNITLPRRVLLRLDAKAKAAGESRLSLIAKMAVG